MSNDLHSGKPAPMSEAQAGQIAQQAVGSSARIQDGSALLASAKRATGASTATVLAWIDGKATPTRKNRSLLDAAGLSMVGAASKAGTPQERRGRPRTGEKILRVRAGDAAGEEDLKRLEGELRSRGFCVGDASERSEAKTTP